MRQPLEFEIQDYLRENAKDIGNGVWLISGRACPERMAKDLSELALITGQPLAVFPSLLGALVLARRVCSLEQQMEKLMERVRP